MGEMRMLPYSTPPLLSPLHSYPSNSLPPIEPLPLHPLTSAPLLHFFPYSPSPFLIYPTSQRTEGVQLFAAERLQIHLRRGRPSPPLVPSSASPFSPGVDFAPSKERAQLPYSDSTGGVTSNQEE